MGNISALSSITTAATALSNLVLVSPQSTIGYQPQNPTSSSGQTSQPPPAILFHYEGEQTVALESDITDHYIEDNTTIQDQWALKPETITTHGFIGELNDVAPGALAAVQAVADKLTVIDAYTPGLSATALLAYNEAFQAYQLAQNAANSAVAAWSSLSGTGGESVIGAQGLILQPNQTKQQVAFQQFYGYWRSRTLFTVQTPWAVFQNMAIKSLRAIQDAETNVITDFEVTFKMIRTAATVTTPGLNLTYQGRAATQSASLTDLGTSTPVSSISLSQGLTSNFPSSFPGGL
jgi:hypothetical protein